MSTVQLAPIELRIVAPAELLPARDRARGGERSHPGPRSTAAF